MSKYKLQYFEINNYLNNKNHENIINYLENDIINCKSCSLSSTIKNKVIYKGSLSPKILFIGEAPGFYENLVGVPFSGASGKILKWMIQKIGIEEKDYAVINTIKCRPPKNRKPTINEIKQCSKFLKTQVFLMNPKMIILLGNTAEELLRYNLYKEKLNWGECTISYDKRYILKLYHPAALLYNKNLIASQTLFIDKYKYIVKKLIKYF